MTPVVPNIWLLLIHQIPPKPDALRVKIWRRLQQVGAVAVKQSVYVMPFSEQSREDLSWTLKQIIAGGGEGSISEARFVEGLTDRQIVALFDNARQSDFEKIIRKANALLSEGSSGEDNPREPRGGASAQVSRIRRRFEEVSAIDFFQAPERGAAELLIKELEARLSRKEPSTPAVEENLESLTGKTWVTRKNIFVDRIGCGWLIRRFADESAVFKFVDAARYGPAQNEIRFDMFDGEFTHEGERCTFEVMIQRLGLGDRAIALLAEVVHDIDLKDGKYGRAETDGFNALLSGLTTSLPDDDRRMAEGIGLFDNLYAFYQRYGRE